MLTKKNKTCIACGEKYTFCTGCSEFDHLPRWMALYHNANCKELFDITTGYLCGELTKEQAKERYEKCDLSHKEILHKNIQKCIDELCNSTEEITAVTVGEETLENSEAFIEEVPAYRKKISKMKYQKSEEN